MTAPTPDAIWEPHLKVQWGGNIGFPNLEEWSNTVRFFGFEGDEGMPSAAQLQAACDAASVPLADWFTNSSNGIAHSASLTFIKLNGIGSDGRQVGTSTIVHEYPIDTILGQAAGSPIWSQTYAITLRTTSHRGRAHAGRIFPPLVVGPPEGGTPYLTAVAAAAMAAVFATCLTNMSAAINTALGAAGFPTPAYGPGVMSPGSIAKGTPVLRGSFRSAVVDRVADIQHRRTRQVPRLEGTSAPIV